MIEPHGPVPKYLHRFRRLPDLCRDVQEKIGSWPNSEPELAALQATA